MNYIIESFRDLINGIIWFFRTLISQSYAYRIVGQKFDIADNTTKFQVAVKGKRVSPVWMKSSEIMSTKMIEGFHPKGVCKIAFIAGGEEQLLESEQLKKVKVGHLKNNNVKVVDKSNKKSSASLRQKYLKSANGDIASLNYTLLSMVYLILIVLSSLLAHRFVYIFGLLLPGGVLIFPLSYFVLDVVCDVWGYQYARRTVWMVFACQIIFSLLPYLVIYRSGPVNEVIRSSYINIFSIMPRMSIASIVAVVFGSFVNLYCMAKFKLMTNGQHLWFRTICATTIGEFVLSITWAVIAFIGTVSWAHVLNIMANIYIFKMLYEIVATPLISLLIDYIKRQEGIDIFDYNTNFNPFKLKIEFDDQ